MPSLVHTADVHLQPTATDRLDALTEVLSVTESLGAEVLTIGGDLFNHPETVDQLRGHLRTEYFTDLPFDILLIPGNHDVEAFRGDLHFGDAVTVIANPQGHYQTWTTRDESLRITAIPYHEHPTDDLILALNNRDEIDGEEALLFHGSLDAPIPADPGDESTYRYFPVTKDLLTDLGFDYYLAGHYHNPHHLHLESGAEFAYPGTPASTRTAETGRRSVVTLDPDTGLGVEPINTFHYLKTTFTVTPGDKQTLVEAIEAWVDANLTEYTEAMITVEGVFDAPEATFNATLTDAAGPAEITNRALTVDHVIDHPVIQEFRARLDAKDWDDTTKEHVWTRTLRKASQLGSAGGFQ